ncbi:hypothetical protein [Microtetraspora sp. AC03309]|uniref:hypothetical protein n=1 Tax=Microtetraspora sp. AC03309 TaxID=2779376 RepID=UPI001E5880A9|nr:hypothetical protein [Microtetraspora sp. AC03309]
MDTISPVHGSTSGSHTPERIADVGGSAEGGRPAGRRRRAAAFLTSRWLPAIAASGLSVAVLLHYGVSVRDLVVFSAYVLLCVAVPGVLLIRALYKGRRTWAEEIALGLALGYAVEVFTYIAARAIGLPLLVLVWPATTYAIFIAVPRLRRHWRGGRHTGTTPLWFSWALVLLVAYLLGWGAASYFAVTPLDWPGLAAAPPDVAFHLALTGELKHQMPPMVPMVAGEPLSYHWFVYAHFAASSWITGVEPLVLVNRIGVLPMLLALVVLFGMTARRVTRSWTAALLATAGTVMVAIPGFFVGQNGPFSWGGVPDLAWTSPTQTFGALLFATVVLLLIDLLEHRHTGSAWILLAIFLLAVMGAKATYLPMLGAGLAAITLVEAVRHRRLHRPALVALGMTAACLLYAQCVLFGGARSAIVIAPLFFMRTCWQAWRGLSAAVDPPTGSLVGVTSVFLLSLVVMWSGILGLLSRARSLTRHSVILMLGIGVIGLGTALMLGHPGRSQLFFMYGAYPYLVILSVYGLLVLVRRARVPRRAAICAAVAGIAVAYLIPFVCGVTIPLGRGQGDSVLYRPYLVLVAVSALAGTFLLRTWGGYRAWALMSVASVAIALQADVQGHVLSVLPRVVGGGLHEAAGSTEFQESQAVQSTLTAPGLMAAGRWLRSHSDPRDLIATNAHCRPDGQVACDERHFWVAALSERRVLVEGWAFTGRNMSQWRPGTFPEYLPFWDRERLRANDLAFTSPSRDTMERLRDRYGVRWLFVDERDASSRIGAFATLRFRSPGCAIYELPRAA